MHFCILLPKLSIFVHMQESTVAEQKYSKASQFVKASQLLARGQPTCNETGFQNSTTPTSRSSSDICCASFRPASELLLPGHSSYAHTLNSCEGDDVGGCSSPCLDMDEERSKCNAETSTHCPTKHPRTSGFELDDVPSLKQSFPLARSSTDVHNVSSRSNHRSRSPSQRSLPSTVFRSLDISVTGGPISHVTSTSSLPVCATTSTSVMSSPLPSKERSPRKPVSHKKMCSLSK